MSDSGAGRPATRIEAHTPSPPGPKVPTAEDVYTVPLPIVRCLLDLAPRIHQSGAWWSLGGDLAENMLNVHVRPTEITILTDLAGIDAISGVLSNYRPAPVAERERRVERDGELDGQRYPIFERSRFTEFTTGGVRVLVHGDYQLKVGEWEWGDPLFFEPTFMSLAGTSIPLMPLKLKSEMYITLGWVDRAMLISDAYLRAHSSTHG